MWKHYYILKLNLKKLNVKNKYDWKTIKYERKRKRSINFLQYLNIIYVQTILYYLTDIDIQNFFIL